MPLRSAAVVKGGMSLLKALNPWQMTSRPTRTNWWKTQPPPMNTRSPTCTDHGMRLDFATVAELGRPYDHAIGPDDDVRAQLGFGMNYGSRMKHAFGARNLSRPPKPTRQKYSPSPATARIPINKSTNS